MDNKPKNKRIYYNLDIIWHNVFSFYTGIFGLLILLISGYLGFYIAEKRNQHVEDNNHRMTDMIRQHENDLLAIQQQLNFVSVELEVEKVASQRMQADLQHYKLQNAELKKELAFYQNVMAPELNAEGVVLANLKIEPTLSENHFRYRVVLVQTRKQKRFAKGFIDLSLQGYQQGKPQHLSLSDMGVIDSATTKFSFRYFQELTGELTLPRDFEPERINITVNIPKSRRQKAGSLDTNFEWQIGKELIE